MRQQRKQLLRAFAISLVLVVAFIVIGSRVPMLSRLYIIAAPGWFGASLLFTVIFAPFLAYTAHMPSTVSFLIAF
jgi:hypothetical protein